MIFFVSFKTKQHFLKADWIDNLAIETNTVNSFSPFSVPLNIGGCNVET